MSAIPVERMPIFVDEPPPPESRLPPERRKRTRTKVHWPVCFFRDATGERVESLTQDLSSGGFCCLADTPFTAGETLMCLLKLPSHGPNGKHLEQMLECKARVMRVELQDEGVYGIACRIEDYHLVIGTEPRTAANRG
jgi:hypothetical protein